VGSRTPGDLRTLIGVRDRHPRGVSDRRSFRLFVRSACPPTWPRCGDGARPLLLGALLRVTVSAASLGLQLLTGTLR
jgi:hypothetical protein